LLPAKIPSDHDGAALAANFFIISCGNWRSSPALLPNCGVNPRATPNYSSVVENEQISSIRCIQYSVFKILQDTTSIVIKHYKHIIYLMCLAFPHGISISIVSLQATVDAGRVARRLRRPLPGFIPLKSINRRFYKTTDVTMVLVNHWLMMVSDG
jgi:hypothetical protein